MENPLELEAPTDVLNRTHAFVRDLAYCTIRNQIEPTIRLDTDQKWLNFPFKQSIYERSSYHNRLVEKWTLDPSTKESDYLWALARSFGYIELSPWTSNYPLSAIKEFILTPKAFALLEEPPIAPKVFISYKREYSSALALLIEAKLKLRDSTIGIFIDKLIKPGDDWAENIQMKIKDCRYFICLLAPDSYAESEWLRKELEWAYDAGCEIISVFHAAATLSDRYPAWLGKKQIIKVDFETAKHYESALDEVLVGLGYSTY